jgi:hypothetical protein
MRPNALTRFLHILVHPYGAAVGKGMGERDFRCKQFQAMALQSQLVWSGREIGKLVPESVQVGMKIRQRNLLCDRQTADVFICFQNKNAQSRLGEVARTGQAIVSRADDDGIIKRRYSQHATTML